MKSLSILVTIITSFYGITFFGQATYFSNTVSTSIKSDSIPNSPDYDTVYLDGRSIEKGIIEDGYIGKSGEKYFCQIIKPTEEPKMPKMYVDTTKNFTLRILPTNTETDK